MVSPFEAAYYHKETGSMSADFEEYPSPDSIHVAKPRQPLFRTQSALIRIRERSSFINPKHKHRILEIRDQDGNQIPYAMVRRFIALPIFLSLQAISA